MPNLLIVDSCDEDRDTLQRSLESLGFQVSAASEGVEALERARANCPDAIISGVVLPGMSGFELCHQWNADELLRSVPFIFQTTGDGNPEDERFGKALGARSFVRQPIAAPVLADIVNKAMTANDLPSEERSEFVVDARLRNAEASRRTLLSILEDQKRMADALRVSEQRARAIIDSALDGIITIDHEGRVVEINPAAEKMFDLPPGSALGHLLAESVIPPRLREQHRIGLARYVENGGESNLLGRRIEMTGWRADGAEFPIELTVTRIPTDGPPMFTGHVRDITERQEAEENLRNSEARFRTIFEQAAVGVAQLNSVSGIILQINRRYCEIIGLSVERLAGKTWMELTHPDDLAEDLARMEKLRAGDIRQFTISKRLQRSDGSFVWINLTVSAMWQPGETPSTHIAIVEDITEQMVASQKLVESEERHRRLIENSPFCIHEIERNGTLSSMNPAGLTIMGLTDESQIRGVAYLSAVCEQDSDRIGELLEQAYAGQTSDFDFTSADGQVFRSCFVPLIDGDGCTQRVMGITQDVTEKLRAEQELRESEAKFRDVAETVPVSIGIAQDGCRVFANRGAEELTGYSRVELLNRPSGSLTHPDFREPVMQLLAHCSDNNTPGRMELKIVRKDGQERWVHLSLAPIQYAGRPAILAASADITDFMLAELKLQESEARYRMMTENATEAIIILDVDTGRFVDFNRNACELYKASHEQLLQMGPADVSPALQPDGTPSETLAMQYAEQAMTGDSPVHVFEWTHQDLEGRIIPSEIRVMRMPDQNRRLLRGAVTDISDRKHGEAERESFIQQLEQKNAELERFTYTVSHDLKSPLITIKGFLGLLERDLEDDRAENVQEDIGEIASAADRMNRLLDDLLELSRIGRIANPVEGVSLQEVAQQAVDVLDAEIMLSGMKIQFDCELPVVTGDRARLLEVFQNLLHNAVKFSAAQPEPEVHLGTRQENGETVIYVQDNGIGIAPEYHERVFSLFEQLTPDGEGTGIGLSLVKRIIHVHGGWIRIDSDGEGHGATFCFTLGAGPNVE